jgi:hypothetical protein
MDQPQHICFHIGRERKVKFIPAVFSVIIRQPTGPPVILRSSRPETVWPVICDAVLSECNQRSD